MKSVKKEGKKRDKELREDLLEIIQRAARDTNLLDAFLQDILAPREYRDIARRLQIVRELKKGISHREIAENLGVGVATIERGVRVIENKSGGMNRLL